MREVGGGAVGQQLFPAAHAVWSVVQSEDGGKAWDAQLNWEDARIAFWASRLRRKRKPGFEGE
jgi:hypothetical protein